MAKKGSRLREFEKNNRVLDISGAQKTRRKKREAARLARQEEGKSGKGDSRKAAEAAGQGKKSRKHRINRFKLLSWVITAALVIIVGMSVKNILDLRSQADSLTDKQTELLQQKEDLTIELENVTSDDYIEEQARRDLKLVKGNELIFLFPDELDEQTGQAGEDDGQQQQAKE